VTDRPPVLDLFVDVVAQASRDGVPFVDIISSLAWCLVSAARSAGMSREAFMSSAATTWDVADEADEELLS